MRAVTLDSFDAAPTVRADLPDPTAAADGLVVRVGASEDNLRRLAALLDDGTLRVHIHDTFELDRATDALQTLATEHFRGKLAISVG